MKSGRSAFLLIAFYAAIAKIFLIAAEYYTPIAAMVYLPAFILITLTLIAGLGYLIFGLSKKLNTKPIKQLKQLKQLSAPNYR